jgi:hypothetical protein
MKSSKKNKIMLSPKSGMKLLMVFIAGISLLIFGDYSNAGVQLKADLSKRTLILSALAAMKS